MAVRSMFFNAVQNGSSYDRVYSAEDFSGYLDKIIGDGVFAEPSLNLRVIAASPNSMNVVVYSGQGWIKGHKVINTQPLTLPIGAAAASTRKDAVVMYLDYNEREMGFEVKAGTPGSATPPALVQTAERWEYRLATVTVASGTTAIGDEIITDERGTSVCPYVAGLVEQIDASSLFEQWNEQFNDFISDLEESVSGLSGRITGLQRLEAAFNTSSASTSAIDIATHIPTYNPLTDSVEIYVSGLHLSSSEYSRSGSVITLTTPITHSGTGIDLVVYHVEVES